MAPLLACSQIAFYFGTFVAVRTMVSALFCVVHRARVRYCALPVQMNMLFLNSTTGLLQWAEFANFSEFSRSFCIRDCLCALVQTFCTARPFACFP